MHSVMPGSVVPRGALVPRAPRPIAAADARGARRREWDQRCCVASGCPDVVGSPCIRLSVCLSAETGSTLGRGSNPRSHPHPVQKAAVQGAKAEQPPPLEPGGFGGQFPPPSSSSSFFLLSSCWETWSPVLRGDCAAIPGCVQSINCYWCNNCSVSREMPERAEKIERPVRQLGRRLRCQESNCSAQKRPVSGFPSTARKNPQCLFDDNKKKLK